MPHSFLYRDASGTMKAGLLEASEEYAERIIGKGENYPLLMVKGYNYMHACPFEESPGKSIEPWKQWIPLKKEVRSILVSGDTNGSTICALLLTYAYEADSRIVVCNSGSISGEQVYKTGKLSKCRLYTTNASLVLPTLSQEFDLAYLNVAEEGLEQFEPIWECVKEKGVLVLDGLDTTSLSTIRGQILGVANGQVFLQKD